MTTKIETPAAAISVGNTPLLEIKGLAPRLKKVRVFAKAEWHNPGGSVKDRAGLRIIQEAEKTGLMNKEKVLLDASSGNTGIAYSWICARLGYRLKLAIPSSVNTERKALLRTLGADLIFTDPLESSDGAIEQARRLAKADPDLYYYADQYNNQANWMAHRDGTAREIFEQTNEEVTHFVAGLGTTGTFVGTGRGLKTLKPGIHLVSMEPDAPLHGLEGLKHMETALVPGIYDRTLAHERLVVSTEDGQETARRLARTSGILIGPSGGANLKAALITAQRLEDSGRTGTVVTIFPDSGERYLSEKFWKL